MMQVTIVDDTSCRISQLKTPCFVYSGKVYALVNSNESPMYKTPENKILAFNLETQALMTFASEAIVLPASCSVIATVLEK
jgi:hypothetical protein